MNITPQERASMVRDIKHLHNKYYALARHVGNEDEFKFAQNMAANYSALASALKEGLSFEATA